MSKRIGAVIECGIGAIAMAQLQFATYNNFGPREKNQSPKSQRHRQCPGIHALVQSGRRQSNLFDCSTVKPNLIFSAGVSVDLPNILVLETGAGGMGPSCHQHTSWCFYIGFYIDKYYTIA
jgi:hypothetical protein